ncbi:MAG: serpin family protein [Phycisphaerae bacterium]|nr:serpin family protein [Phycisphaerae bacterium]
MVGKRSRTVSVVALAVGGSVLVSGCLPWPTTDETLVKSNKAREASPSVSQSDLDELVAGNTAFALDLYSAISDEGINLFCSPYSISIALAMTYAGARGQTEQQMADTLHFTLPQERLHPAFNALDLALASRGKGASGADGEGFRLNIANAIWGQKDYAFLEAYLDVLAVDYGAGMHVVDFVTAPEPARLTINKWVSDRTEGKIKDLIPQGVIDAMTRLVLTNAVYFNAAWKHPFEKSNTKDGTFNLLDGTPVTTSMMWQLEDHRYAAGEGYQAVELRYDGDELSMVILLPDAGNFTTFEGSLDGQKLATILAGLSFRPVNLTLPKFTYESEFSLGQTLSAMGMVDAFTGAADLSGIDGIVGSLFIQEVIHKAFVAVDEAGTEAAAATAVIVGLTAAPDPTGAVEFKVDRPFIFLIRDIETGGIVFLGRVMSLGA